MESFLKDVINSSFSKEISELINFKNLDIGEKFKNFFIQKFPFFKQAALILGQMGFNFILSNIGCQIFMFLPICNGLVIGVAAFKLGLGIASGIGFGILGKKIFRESQNSENLILFSDSLYYQYIPTKFRDYCIPTLYWIGVTKNAQSFAIELDEDGERKWLVINIKKWIRKISNENYNDIGQNIVEYKGISKHPYKVTFILYELNKENFTPEEWGVGKKVEKDYSEKLQKNFIQVAVLNVF